jgi:tetratricopeptide (TPR) repeat protein
MEQNAKGKTTKKMKNKRRYQSQLFWFTGCETGGFFRPGPLHLKRAEILENIGRHQQSEKNVRACIDSAREAGQGKYQAKSLRFLAYIFQVRGDFKSALKTLEEARGIAKEGGHLTELMQIESYIGNVLNITGDYAGAMDQYREHLVLAEKLDDDNGRAVGLGTIGLLYSHREELDKAREYIERSVAICQKIGDARGEAANIGNLGVILAKQGNMDEAMKHFQKQLELAKRQGTKGVEANALLSIALVHQNKGEAEKSLVQFNRIMEIYQSLGDKVGVSNVHWSMGEASMMMEDYRKALDHFEKQKQLAGDIGYRLGVYQAEIGLARAEAALKNHARAAQQASLAAEAAEDFKSKALLLDAYILLAKILYDSGAVQKASDVIGKGLEIDASNQELHELRQSIAGGG